MADWKKNSLHDLHIDSYTAQGFGVARLEAMRRMEGWEQPAKAEAALLLSDSP